MRRRPLLIGLVLLVIRTAKEQEGFHVISLRATCSNMDQGRARVYHLDTGDKTAMKKTEGRWTLDMRFLPDRQMERPMRKRANKREAAEVVAVEPDRHYAQVPCNVACRSNPAPCVQLSGMLRPFLSFSFHRPQQRIRVAFTRSFTHSSFTIIFLVNHASASRFTVQSIKQRASNTSFNARSASPWAHTRCATYLLSDWTQQPRDKTCHQCGPANSARCTSAALTAERPYGTPFIPTCNTTADQSICHSCASCAPSRCAEYGSATSSRPGSPPFGSGRNCRPKGKNC